MTQAVQKLCTVRVRKAAQMVDCGTRLILREREYICPNRKTHVLPFVTGFCDSGWHEGYKINKPTCKFWMTCPCDCHTQLSRMAALTETERVLVDESTWVSGNTFVQVSLTESINASALNRPGAVMVASELPDLVPATFRRDFTPTASGRTQRGQLEVWVHDAVQYWMTERTAGVEMPTCTPQWVSERILSEGVTTKSPSTGAIDAVFKRWIEIGYANIGSRPTRFVSFTVAGIKDGLEVMKARAKRR